MWDRAAGMGSDAGTAPGFGSWVHSRHFCVSDRHRRDETCVLAGFGAKPESAVGPLAGNTDMRQALATVRLGDQGILVHADLGAGQGFMYGASSTVLLPSRWGLTWFVTGIDGSDFLCARRWRSATTKRAICLCREDTGRKRGYKACCLPADSGERCCFHSVPLRRPWRPHHPKRWFAKQE